MQQSECTLHRDDEERGKTCNGLKKDGNCCGSRVKPANCEDQAAKGLLPRCQVHVAQRLYAGRCEATASCGERCNRLIAWQPGYNQLCSDHENETLRCRIMTLPSELRLEIFDLLVPKGPMSDFGRGRYKDAFSLLLVNRIFHAETTRLLFLAGSHPCEVSVGAEGFELFGRHYNTDLVQLPQSWNHVSQVSQHRPDRIAHLELAIKLQYGCQNDVILAKTIVSIWCIAQAIMS